MEKLTVGASPDLVDHRGLKINEDGPEMAIDARQCSLYKPSRSWLKLCTLFIHPPVTILDLTMMQQMGAQPLVWVANHWWIETTLISKGL